jgi:hypothetical protein
VSTLRDGVGALRTAVLDLLPLEQSRALRYFSHGRRWPDLEHPQGLNEKINWRVLHDQRELWTWTCDKLAMKRRAAELAPTVRIPETLWSGMDVRDLASHGLVGRWILKPNNGSGHVVVGTGTPDVDDLERRVERWDRAYQWRTLGEIAYLRADPTLLVERWIGSEDEPPNDYKLFVFAGRVEFIHAHTGRFEGHRASLYTRDWERINARQSDIKPHEADLPRPPRLLEMIEIAEAIARDCDFIRIDLFDTVDGVWFGETTPYPWSGGSPFFPHEFEVWAGSLWTLPDLSST